MNIIRIVYFNEVKMHQNYQATLSPMNLVVEGYTERKPSDQNISSFIEWHDADECLIHGVDKTMPGKFGILHIDIPPMPVCTGTLAVMFNIDQSGSMDDVCSDSSTKMQHIQHALKNILRVFIKTVETEPNLTIRIAICVFSHSAKNLFHMVTDVSGAIVCDEHGFITINSENIQSVFKKIDTIDPWGLTNIEKSLKYTQISLEDYHAANPIHRLIHIQFTDGVATVGKKSYQELIEYTDPTYKHIFIGIGDFHDSYLLTNLSQNLCLGEYRFIDQLENSGMICGEILYDILHPFKFPNNPVQIVTNHGVKIYDWRINQWTTCLNLPAFSGNRSKDFHLCFMDETCGCGIRSRVEDNHAYSEGRLCCFAIAWSPEEYENVYEKSNIHIYSTLLDIRSNVGAGTSSILLDTAHVLPSLIDSDNTPVLTDLTPFILRQYTQEYLYEAVQYELSLRSDIIVLQRETNFIHNTNDYSINIRKKLEKFLKVLETYQSNMISETDYHFIQVLKDDIIVTLKNMDTQFGFMYTNSRQTSQGNQYSYVPTGERDEQFMDNEGTNPSLERNISTNINRDIFNMMTQVQDTDMDIVLTEISEEEFPIPSPIRRASLGTSTPQFVFPNMENYISTQQIN